MTSYQDTFCAQLNDMFAAAKVSGAVKLNNSLASKAANASAQAFGILPGVGSVIQNLTELANSGSDTISQSYQQQSYSNLLHTNPSHSTEKFERFSENLAEKFAANRTDLSEDAAKQDAAKVLKLMCSGKCGEISDPKTSPDLLASVTGAKAVAASNFHQHVDRGDFTHRILEEESHRHPPSKISSHD